MIEKFFVEPFNEMWRQFESAQIPSDIALAVFTVMSMMRFLVGSYPYADIFVALLVVTVGSLSVLNQFAVIREAQSVVKDLQDIKDLSRVAQNITASGSYLIYTRVLMAVFSLALLIGLALLVL